MVLSELAKQMDRLIATSSGKTIQIVEVGFAVGDCVETIVQLQESGHPFVFTSVGLDLYKLGALHTKLEFHDWAQYATLLLQDPARYLSTLRWVDAVLINDWSRGLDGTRELYRQSASAGASVISITRYQSCAAHAVSEARAHGWNYTAEFDRSILTRDNG